MTRRALPRPLVTPDVDVRDLDGFMLNAERLMASELYALSTGDEFKAAVALWCRAWKQIPAASLPNDERVLASFSGAGTNWPAVREMALRGFELCSDGRLYHRVLSQDALKAYEKKREYTEERTGNAERKKKERDERAAMFKALKSKGITPPWNVPTRDLRDLVTLHGVTPVTPPVTVTVTANTGQGQGQGQGQRRKKILSPSSSSELNPERSYVTPPSSEPSPPSGPVADAPGHTMDEHSLRQWWDQCRATIPRQSSFDDTLRLWRKLPPTPVDDLVEAWARYVADNRTQSEGHRHPVRTRYPATWFTPNGPYANYLDAAADERIAREKREAAEAATVEQWNGKAQDMVERIGFNKFHTRFSGAQVIVTDEKAVITAASDFLFRQVFDDRIVMGALTQVFAPRAIELHVAKHVHPTSQQRKRGIS